MKNKFPPSRFIGVSQIKNHQKSKESMMVVFHFLEIHLKHNHFSVSNQGVFKFLVQNNIKISISLFRQKVIQIFKQLC